MFSGVESSRILLEDKLALSFSFNANCNIIADNELPPKATKSSSGKTKSTFKTFLNPLTTSLRTSSVISTS